MKKELNTLAVLLKEIQKAGNFDEFSGFVFDLFKWLGAERLYFKVEEFNKKYYQIYYFDNHHKQKIRLLKKQEPKFFKSTYQSYLNQKNGEFKLEVKDHKKGEFLIKVNWSKANEILDFDEKLELLKPSIELKMEQLILVQNLKKYEDILENSVDTSMLIEKGELEYVSPQVKNFTGFDLGMLNQENLAQIFLNTANRKDIDKKIKKDIQSKNEVSIREYPIKDKDGKVRWIEWVVRRIFDSEGEIQRMILNFRDISDKKKAESELSYQKRFLHEILDKLPFEIYLKDLDAKYIFINALAAKNNGIEDINVQGKKDEDIFSKVKAAQYRNEDERVKAGEIISSNFSQIKDGITRFYFTQKQLIEMGESNVILTYSIDISEQKRSEEQLNENTRFIDRSLSLIPDSIFIFDLENFGYVYSNDKLFQMLGFETKHSGEKLEKFIRKILHPEDVEAYFNQLEEIKKGEKENYELEYRVYSHNGKKHWLFSRKTPLKKDKNGRVQQYVGITINITDQKIKEQRLLSTQTELKEALKAREEFLSVISHEIRTPLNAIVGIASLLDQAMEQEEKDELIKVLKENGESLLLMINDILDFSKIKAGEMQFDITDIKILKLLKNMCKSFQVQSEDKGIGMTCIVDPKLPKYIKSDPVRLNQILNNLISNALKFTNKGSIDLSANIIEEDEKEIEICFVIKDSGIGIEKDKLEMIFDPFKQIGSKKNRTYGGTGLGLSITKELIEQMGGRLEVDSKEGIGSEFRAFLRFEKTSSLDEIIEDKGSDKRYADFQGTDSKVLYIEDVASNRMLMNAYCKLWKIELHNAENGLIGLELLEEKHFDLILLDLQMPGMDGFEVMSHIKNTLKINSPVLALSADVSQSVADQIKASGMSGYISKPIQTDILYTKFRQFLALKKDSAKQISESGNSNLHNLKEIYGGDENEFRIYINNSLEELNALNEDIIKAIQNQDLKLFRDTRHKYLGPIGVFKMDSFREFLDELLNAWDEMVSEKSRKLTIERLKENFSEVEKSLTMENLV